MISNKKTFTKTLKVIALSLSFYTGSTTFVSFESKAANESSINSLSGKITDKKTGTPLKDVYIKQLNTLNTVLSNDKGTFEIRLDPSAPSIITVAKEGYEKLQFNINSGTKSLNIEMLSALTIKDDNLPSPHTEVSDIFNYTNRPVSSTFSALYQIRQLNDSYPALTNPAEALNTGGWAINELAMDGKIRLENWLGSFKVFRSRSPIDVSNFDYKPIYYIDTLQFQAAASKVFQVSENVDLTAGLSYLLHFNTPDNKGGSDNKPIPYTNSYMDFPQMRQGPGLSGTVGYKLNERTILSGGLTLYPYLFNRFDGLIKNDIGYSGMLESGLNLKVETLQGVYLAASYTNQWFFSNTKFNELANMFNIGISLDPFKMANVAPVKMNAISK